MNETTKIAVFILIAFVLGALVQAGFTNESSPDRMVTADISEFDIMYLYSGIEVHKNTFRRSLATWGGVREWNIDGINIKCELKLSEIKCLYDGQYLWNFINER